MRFLGLCLRRMICATRFDIFTATSSVGFFIGAFARGIVCLIKVFDLIIFWC